MACLLLVGLRVASASPGLVVDVDSGDVLYQDAATVPWFPASTTKLMTVYVALSAVKDGRITLETPMMVSPRAASMAPSKMGFRPGTLVTLDNALKMLMVKSPNDIAVTIAEGVSGSVEAFADDMNVYATRLGLHESHFVNPNGLPDERHTSSARDMAMIGRALLRDFPEQSGLFDIGVLNFNGRLIPNHNGLLGRYPGADGMKTGFTCSAGYNLVLSARRNGRHLIAVVMGAPSTRERDMRAAALLDRYFALSGASVGQLDSLPGSGVTTPPDNRSIVCGRGRAGAIAEAEAEDASIPLAGPDHAPGGFAFATAGQATTVPSTLLPTRIAFEPVRVFIGPVAGWSGRVAQAIGGGAKELDPAPVKFSGGQERALNRPVAASGPIEDAAPAPMALLGATPLAPAALATKRLAGAAPGLSLAVGSKPLRGHRVAVRAPTRVARAQQTAPAAPATRPKGRRTAQAVSVAKPAPAKKKASFTPGTATARQP